MTNKEKKRIIADNPGIPLKMHWDLSGFRTITSVVYDSEEVKNKLENIVDYVAYDACISVCGFTKYLTGTEIHFAEYPGNKLWIDFKNLEFVEMPNKFKSIKKLL